MTWTLLVNLTLKSTLVLAIAWVAALALRRRSAAARHIVWTAASAALLALPLLSLSLPAWHHPLAACHLPLPDVIRPAENAVPSRTTATAGEVAGPPAPSTPSSTARAT